MTFSASGLSSKKQKLTGKLNGHVDEKLVASPIVEQELPKSPNDASAENVAAAKSAGGDDALTSVPSKRVKKTKSLSDASSASGESSKRLKKTQKVKGQSNEEAKDENGSDDKPTAKFVGDTVPNEEAKQRWPARYQGKITLLGMCFAEFEDGISEYFEFDCGCM